MKSWGIARVFLLIGMCWAGMPVADLSAGQMPHIPSKNDRCPVCGMFTAKYPDWAAQIIFKDGSYATFDGTRDMMKYLFDMKKYDPSRDAARVDAIFVKDYYSLDVIDAKKAFYVEGSSVNGPMGRELVPFKSRSEALGFMKDHQGKHLLTFPELDRDLIKGLD
jgi:copper chaperone NosL